MPRPPRVHPAAELPDPARAPDHLVAAVRAAVTAHASVTVPRDVLWQAAVARDASMAHEDGRYRLAAVLAALAAGGEITLPRGEKSWDRGPRPRLPLTVRRVQERRPLGGRAVVPDEVLAALPADAAVRLAVLRISADDVADLSRVAAWLAAGGADRPVVPSRERSLQVFGDEKRLDGLVAGRLFTAGVLSLELLRAEPVPLPLTATWVPGRRSGEARCLVVENHHTWVSLLRRAWATAGAHAGVHVGWGAGKQFPQGMAGVRLLEPPVAAVAYFGDVDAGGLTTARTAADRAGEHGLPPVLPALGLYDLLFRVGRPQRVGSSLDAAAAAERAAWLGRLAEPAAEYLRDGYRLAQEWVGTEVLAGTTPDEWW